MSHQVRYADTVNTGKWWTCIHCDDRWRQPPTDICPTLLARLEAEQAAGWTTVGLSCGDADALVRILARHFRPINERMAS